VQDSQCYTAWQRTPYGGVVYTPDARKPGDAAGEIIRAAETQKADMIVIATHGATGWQRPLFGSVAEKVVRLASCPVLTIRKRN